MLHSQPNSASAGDPNRSAPTPGAAPHAKHIESIVREFGSALTEYRADRIWIKGKDEVAANQMLHDAIAFIDASSADLPALRDKLHAALDKIGDRTSVISDGAGTNAKSSFCQALRRACRAATNAARELSSAGDGLGELQPVPRKHLQTGPAHRRPAASGPTHETGERLTQWGNIGLMSIGLALYQGNGCQNLAADIEQRSRPGRPLAGIPWDQIKPDFESLPAICAELLNRSSEPEGIVYRAKLLVWAFDMSLIDCSRATKGPLRQILNSVAEWRPTGRIGRANIEDFVYTLDILRAVYRMEFFVEQDLGTTREPQVRDALAVATNQVFGSDRSALPLLRGPGATTIARLFAAGEIWYSATKFKQSSRDDQVKLLPPFALFEEAASVIAGGE